jgi:hypothetical protein
MDFLSSSISVEVDESVPDRSMMGECDKSHGSHRRICLGALAQTITSSNVIWIALAKRPDMKLEDELAPPVKIEPIFSSPAYKISTAACRYTGYEIYGTRCSTLV